MGVPLKCGPTGTDNRYVTDTCKRPVYPKMYLSVWLGHSFVLSVHTDLARTAQEIYIYDTIALVPSHRRPVTAMSSHCFVYIALGIDRLVCFCAFCTGNLEFILCQCWWKHTMTPQVKADWNREEINKHNFNSWKRISLQIKALQHYFISASDDNVIYETNDGILKYWQTSLLFATLNNSKL